MNTYPIEKILGEEFKDSRGNPTIKVTVWAGNASGSFSVPSGASTGSHEAHELRDADGAGVKQAIGNVNNIIAPALLGKNVSNQREIDETMLALDGTPNKEKLGGNSIIGVSIACAKAAAKASGQETFEYLQTLAEIKPSRKIPYLYMNLLEGGKHAKNNLAFQEYHVVPEAESISESISMGIMIDNALKEIILKDLGDESTALGDEGGFAPKISETKTPIFYLREAIKQCELEGRVKIALDVAATSFYNKGIYRVDGKDFSKQELFDLYISLAEEFKLLSIEDPFEEEDFDSFTKLREQNSGLFIVGDDLTVTNKVLLRKAIENKCVNAMIIKPNQIGTLTETLETMQLARENGIELIVSHRSGETDDDFIADLAFAFGCFGLKAGAPTKPERMVKYERLKYISQLK